MKVVYSDVCEPICKLIQLEVTNILLVL